MKKDILDIVNISYPIAIEKATKYTKNKFFPEKMRPEIWSKLIKNPCRVGKIYFEQFKKKLKRLNSNYGEKTFIEEKIHKMIEKKKKIIEIENQEKLKLDILEILRVIEYSNPEIGYNEGIEELILYFFKIGCDQIQNFIITFNLIFSFDMLNSFYTHNSLKVKKFS